ncbi:MAG: glycosyltransferase [candidate division WOR-3 bacterium]
MKPSARGLKIAVTGLAASYPLGGVFWDYFQYVIGFLLLGHDVIYIEDTGQWCYNPEKETFSESGAAHAAYLEKQIRSLPWDLSDRWYYRDGAGNEYGLSWQKVVEFCEVADLFLNISGACWMRDEYFKARRTAFVDSDPMYTQALVPDYLNNTISLSDKTRVEAMLRHQVFFTFGENIYHNDCLVPLGLFAWVPTRQPILFDYLYSKRVPIELRRRVFTTIGSTEPSLKPLVVAGQRYYGKSVELRRFIGLPRWSPVPLELAMSGGPEQLELTSEGWRFIRAYEVSKDPWVYLGYLARSFGEWSVAKNAYVASRSGWFSCRTACYMALGVPGVVQDTGFSRFFPVGEGLLPFETLEDAAASIAEVTGDPKRHAIAAADISREYFDYRVVLPALLDRAFSSQRSSAASNSVPEVV